DQNPDASGGEADYGHLEHAVPAAGCLPRELLDAPPELLTQFLSRGFIGRHSAPCRPGTVAVRASGRSSSRVTACALQRSTPTGSSSSTAFPSTSSLVLPPSR